MADSSFTVISVSDIETQDTSTQLRVDSFDNATLLRYMELWQQAGDNDYPFDHPIELFCDGSRYWLADGWLRTLSAIQAGRDLIEANVRNGSKDDAMVFAASCNHRHGKPSSPADRRKAVETCIELRSTWSDKRIAEWCHVHRTVVAGVREHLSAQKETSHPTKIQGAITHLPKPEPGDKDGEAGNSKPKPPKKQGSGQKPDVLVAPAAEEKVSVTEILTVDQEIESLFGKLARAIDRRAAATQSMGPTAREYQKNVQAHLGNGYRMWEVWKNL